MGIIIAVILFSAIVLIHELGHFLLAKKNKITVTEFSFGMGPRLVSTVKGGTRYSIKLLPIGGSCAMLGEDMDEDSQGTFGSASVWSRISVVAAGPIFNFILAFVLAVIIVACLGYAPAQVMDVTEGSAAEQAGLQDGDVIESRFAVERRNRTIHARMREYLYELKHNDALTTSIIPLGDGVAVSIKQ